MSDETGAPLTESTFTRPIFVTENGNRVLRRRRVLAGDFRTREIVREKCVR